MKLRMPTKLGFKNPKHIMAIFVTNDYPGGYWEDQGYNWFSGWTKQIVAERRADRSRGADRDVLRATAQASAEPNAETINVVSCPAIQTTSFGPLAA